MIELRIGVIGAGTVFRERHLPALHTLPGVSVVAVANRTYASARRVADRFGIRHCEAHWSGVLKRGDVDAIMVGTWPDTHCEIVSAALEAGLDVFCQAPLAATLAEAERMAAAAGAHPGRVSMVCPSPLRMPHDAYIRELLTSGRLGRVTAVDVISTSGANLSSETATWRERVELCGTQTLNLGGFAETLHAWVGPYVSVCAASTFPIGSKRDSRGHPVRIEVPQVVMVAGVLENGAAGVEYHSGVVADHRTPHEMVTIHGLDGTLRYDFETSVLKLAPRSGTLEEIDVPKQRQRGWRVEEDFVTAVRSAREGRRPWPRGGCLDFEEALAAMRHLEAVHRSAATGVAVNPAEL